MHNHTEDYTKELESASKTSIILNAVFVVIEIIGGLYTNSIAILSDAIHDLGDVITLIISYILIKISKKDKTINYNFGFRGLIVIGAIINTIIILSTSGFILIKSLNRIAHPEAVDAKVMFLIALFGVIINGMSVYKFHNQKNVMSRSLMLHLLEDALGWVAILISSIFIMVFKIYMIDAFLSFGISLFLVVSSIRNIINIVNIILYRVPKNIKVKEVENIVNKIEGIVNIKELKIWSVEGETVYCILDIQIIKDLIPDQVDILKDNIRDSLKGFNIQHITIETTTKE